MGLSPIEGESVVMNLFAYFEARFQDAANALKEAGALPAETKAAITVEPPRDLSHGDIASNAAMVLAKEAKLPPRELAALFARQLETLPEVAKVDIAGPGFINLTLKPDFWPRLLRSILEEGEAFGRAQAG